MVGIDVPCAAVVFPAAPVVFDPVVVFAPAVIFDPAGFPSIRKGDRPDAPCVWNLTPKSEIVIAIIVIIAALRFIVINRY